MLSTTSALAAAMLATVPTAAPAAVPHAGAHATARKPAGPHNTVQPPPLHGVTNGKAHFDELPRAGSPSAGASQGNATFTPTPSKDMANPKPGSPSGTGQGPVMTAPVIYNIFWLPTGKHFEPDNLATSDTRFENLINQAGHDLGGNDYFAINTQYPGSNGTPANALTFGGSIVVTSAYPHAGTASDPLLETDINSEVNSVTSSQGWPTTVNDLYAVYTASKIEECDGTAHNNCTPGVTAVKGNFCAYHEFTTPPHAYMPSYCYTRAPNPSPNGDQDADSTIEIFTHELFESITDPNGNAWQGAAGASAEIGDLCNAQNGYTNANGANAYLGGGHGYTVELQWSNAVHGCVESLNGGSVTPPSVSVSKTVDNSTPQVGDTVTYTITATNTSNTGPATNLSFTDNLPAGYTVTGVNDPGANSDTVTANQVIVGYDHLAVHDSLTFTVSATVPNQPLHTSTNCASLALQNEITMDVAGVTSSPCASVTPADQPISLIPLAATGTEGNSTIALATLTDPDPAATASEYAATVDWGDGSAVTSASIVGPTHGPWTVQGAHLYAEEGSYSATVTVTDVSDDPANTASAKVQVSVADAALTSGAAQTINAVEGAPWSGTVATFTDADPNGAVGDYSATIHWGDGTSDTGTIGGGPVFTVGGSHTYLEEGTYPVSVSINDVGGASTTAQATFVVADAALTASGRNFNTTNPVNATVATFTDADPNGTVSDYTAKITWGDGSPVTNGTVSAISGGFAVNGTHTYSGTGATSYTVHIHICDVGGSCSDATTVLRLTYMTGRAFGLSVNVSTPSRAIGIGPMPDTGHVQNSLASTTHTPCTLTLSAVVVTAGAMCVNVTTTTAPDTSTATATVARATLNVGLGLPTIGIVGLTSKSTSSCSSASGGIKITSLTIGGKAITVTGAANVTINLGVAGAKLIVNEQQLVLGANGDKVLTVNGLHLIVPTALGVSADAVVASATSDIHNCADPAAPASVQTSSPLTRMMQWWDAKL